MDLHRRDRGGMYPHGERHIYPQQRHPMHGSHGRAIPPSSIPSLSTGQGFYTVESLEGVTVVPPPQPAPPPPRIMPAHHPFDKGPPFRPRQPPLPRPHIFPDPRRMRPPPFPMGPRMPALRPGKDSFVRPEHAWGSLRRFGAGRVPEHARRSDPSFERMKRRKPNSDQEAGWCDVCKIRCYDSLEQHVAGKRHKRQLEGQAKAEVKELSEGKGNEGDETSNADRAEEVIGDTEMGGDVSKETEKGEKTEEFLDKETELDDVETEKLEKAEGFVNKEAESSTEKVVWRAGYTNLPAAGNHIDKTTSAEEDVGKTKAAEEDMRNVAEVAEKGIEEVAEKTADEVNLVVEKTPNEGVVDDPKPTVEENTVAANASSMKDSSPSVGGKKRTKKVVQTNKKLQVVKRASNSPAAEGTSKEGGLDLTETVDHANGKIGQRAEIQ